MYKVFVDHKPIIFVSQEDCAVKPLTVKFKDLPNTREELRPLLEMVELDYPLYVCCKDVDKAFKKYFKGYKKVLAAGGIVHRKEKYLIIKRNGMWDIPKGKIERGEDREVAAIREIEEECGITGPKVEQFLTHTYHLFKYKGLDAIKTTYWYLLSYDGPKETTPQVNEGITKVKWVSFERMLSIRGKTYGSINELLDAFESFELDTGESDGEAF